MMGLFQPQIAALLAHRDAVVDAWAGDHPGVDDAGACEHEGRRHQFRGDAVA